MKNAPSYSIASVDSALQLAAALQVEGALSVSEAADRLGVARSTAHRLLSMLVYRDFAEQLPDRRYGPGPLMHGRALPRATVARLREVALPHLRRLVDELGETVNLMVLAGADVRFVATVECGHVLRVSGLGRHRVYFELEDDRSEHPVMNRACPGCGHGLLGKNRAGSS